MAFVMTRLAVCKEELGRRAVGGSGNRFTSEGVRAMGSTAHSEMAFVVIEDDCGGLRDG